MRNPVIILMVTLSFSLFCVVKTKMYVRDLNSEISNMEKSKGETLENIKILKAEWAYLNKTGRLHALAKQHLNLATIDLTKVKMKKSELEAVSTVQVNYTPEVRSNWKYKSRDTILRNKWKK